MTRDVLAGDGKMVVVLLKEGWEEDSRKNPAVHEIACLGQIETYEELEGGKYNIVLSGLHRVRLVNEVEHQPYRLAEVEVLQEPPCDDEQEEIIQRRNHLDGLFTRYAELAASGRRAGSDMMTQLELESLVNAVAMVLHLPAEERQALLEMDDAVERCDALIPVLQRHLEALILVRRFEHLKPQEPRLN